MSEAPTSAQAQALAADPRASAFVRANAGSGKTKTLIDRVARLLLAGVKPATILCVTYTKAAAAEMQRRLYDRLGAWSVMEGGALLAQLTELEGEAFDPDRLSGARALFAQALETPGGLKIQTIHAFCEQLLRRFPLEAKVSPGFRVIDDTASAAIATAARARVARLALDGQPGVAEAYSRMSVALDFASFQDMFRAFEADRGALAEFFAREGRLAGAVAWTWAACGLASTSIDDLEAEALGSLDFGVWRDAAAVLAAGGKTDTDCAQALLTTAATPSFEGAVRALCTKDGGSAKWVEKTAAFKPHPQLRAALVAEQAKLGAAQERLKAANVAWDTVFVLTLAHAYLTAYALEKAHLGVLDFADLIERAAALLTGGGAAWVLYKLDGGIEHVLVDEAQDTAPEQWAIVRAITDEFFAGAGARPASPLARTLFVVGDEKQSIYSFQGADPERLIAETQGYVDRIRAAGAQARMVPLSHSWRSAQDVLGFVDATFAGGVAPLTEPSEHPAMRAGDRGCVDLWPLLADEGRADLDAWAPVDAVADDSAVRRLARAIACEIEATVQRGDAVFERGHPAGPDNPKDWRAAGYGDVIILVRKRGPLFEEILRALKTKGVPVAGADRLALSEHIVFDDLLALVRFIRFPADDLTLAALLKSPLCGLADDDIYELALRRAGSLWSALETRAAERPAWVAARELLAWAQAEAGAARPFEFLTRLLGRRDAAGRSMRARILTRLGLEAQDALDEFLGQALAAETRGVHDLESLAADFAALDIVVKREADAGRGEVRVMTAHGAKGLEAPIVFLPETTAQGGRGSPLMKAPAQGSLGPGFLWCGAKDRDCPASAAARAARELREEHEAMRLLYVAMTRARDRLVLCGKRPGNIKDDTKLKGWWQAIRAGFDHAGIGPGVREVPCGDILAQRFGPDPRRLGAPARMATSTAALPGWAAADPAAEPLARFAAPSQAAEAVRAPAPSPLARGDGLGRFRRGDLIHWLLQILPDLAPSARADGARRLLAREPDLTPPQAAEMARAALGVLEDERFAEVFGPGSRAEVALAGTAAGLPEGLVVSGRLDRLVVLPGRVLVADFKTNRPSPARIEDADPAYLAQMAIYTAVLADIFPGRAIEAALVWTDGPRLMPIPEKLLARSLAGLGRGD